MEEEGIEDETVPAMAARGGWTCERHGRLRGERARGWRGWGWWDRSKGWVRLGSAMSEWRAFRMGKGDETRGVRQRAPRTG